MTSFEFSNDMIPNIVSYAKKASQIDNYREAYDLICIRLGVKEFQHDGNPRFERYPSFSP